MPDEVLILGAGLTGMSAAFHLQQAGVRARVFERGSRPGGLAVTDEARGYRFDRTGHLLHLKEGPLRELALGWIGAAHRVIDRDSRVWSHGVYTRYPFQANMHGLPPDVAYACLMGFLEARERPKPERFAHFEAFCRGHFGDGISDHFMIPYNARLWGVAPSEISADWCQRFVPLPKLEDVVAGAVGLHDRALGYNARFVYPERGIGQLSAGLAAAVDGIELSSEVTGIDLDARVVRVGETAHRYDRLVSTLPLARIMALCDVLPDDVREAAAALRCTHLYYLDVALRHGAGKPYHWVYVPEPRYPFYRVGCYSNFSPSMAPPGKASLYVELVDRAEPDLAVLLPKVAAGLVEMGWIPRPEAILFAKLRRIDHAYVIFDDAHEASVARCRAHLADHGVITTGRYGGWNYSSMGDALAFGAEAAQTILGGGAS